jgi:hypothetical protein
MLTYSDVSSCILWAVKLATVNGRRNLVGLTVMMTKIRKYFIHRSAVIRYNVMANDVLPVVVAKIPKAATIIVFRLIFSRFSLPMVTICWPKPSETMYELMLTAIAKENYQRKRHVSGMNMLCVLLTEDIPMKLSRSGHPTTDLFDSTAWSICGGREGWRSPP